MTTSNLVHAHGRIVGNPICGVNDPSQIKSERLSSEAEVIRNVVKSSSQAALGSVDADSGFDLINKAEVILVFGCSFGTTDERWWQAILRRLSNYSKAYLVLFSYEYDKYRKTVGQRTGHIENVRNQLIDAANLDGPLPNGVSERIFVLPSSIIFPFNPTIPEFEQTGDNQQ